MAQSNEEIRDAYDRSSEAYAQQFLDELNHKPLDRELLQKLVVIAGGDKLLDVGCGPGHTTCFLSRLGANAIGLDWSPRMIEVARANFRDCEFVRGDMLALEFADHSFSAINAFYCIVHLTQEQLVTTAKEFYRVLQPEGHLLIAFHAGNGTVRDDNFLDTGALLDFYYFSVQSVNDALQFAGFEIVEVIERQPYETEYPSPRCYFLARKPAD